MRRLTVVRLYSDVDHEISLTDMCAYLVWFELLHAKVQSKTGKPFSYLH